MVGEKIRRAREKHGMSQEQLGLLVNLSQSAVNKLENDKVRPNPRRIAEIANVLDLDPLDLLSEEDGYFITYLTNTDNKAGSQNVQFITNSEQLSKALLQSKNDEIVTLKETITLLQKSVEKYEAIIEKLLARM